LTPRLEALWRAPLAAVLVPLTWPYRGALAARRMWVRPVRVGVPVVSVGNITVGGSGKTPVVAHLAERLTAGGLRVAIVARGYGGAVERRAGIAVASDGAGRRLGADEVGDEPAMLAGRLPGIPIVVSPDRVAAARLARRRFAPDVVLADDAFQHLRLDRDIDVVCLDGRDEIDRLRVLPAGPLREGLGALDRAEVVVATKVEGEAAARAVERLRRLAPRAAVFSAAWRPRGAFAPDGRPVEIAGRDVVALAGIARPDDLAADLERLGARVVARLFYPDHHRYGPVEAGVVAAVAAPDRLVVTTEKDAVRLPPGVLGTARVAVLAADLEVDGDLAGWIRRRLEAVRAS
jgi:tetraacyldisaccharide 4'-kinase